MVNEMGVFLHPSRQSNESHYLKRLIAGPGDTVRIINQRILVNDKMTQEIPLLYDYYVQANANGLSVAQRESYGLNAGGLVNNDKLYRYAITDSVAQIVAAEPNVEYVERKKFAKGIAGNKIAQFAENPQALAWNADNFGPLICPQKGKSIVLNDANLNLYTSILGFYEETKVKKVDELFYVNEILADSIRFNNDYYFFLGDNRHQSIDSRHYGLVPAEKILGIAF